MIKRFFHLKAQLGQLAEKEQGFGSGPSFGELKERRIVRNVESAKRKRNELVDFGVEVDSEKKNGVSPKTSCLTIEWTQSRKEAIL